MMVINVPTPGCLMLATDSEAAKVRSRTAGEWQNWSQFAD
jgi:hypothetical protein